VLERRGGSPPEADVRAAAERLTGDLMQTPPMVSALKLGGERLYAIARRGETVDRVPRPVRVESWDWLAFAEGEARFRVICSGGTYVRTLVHDLGAALGCGAALANLRRLASEPFTVERGCAWEALDESLCAETIASHGILLDRALDTLPAVVLDATGVDALGHGQPAAVDRAPGGASGPRSVVLRDGDGRALALGEVREAPGGGAFAHPQVVFPWAVREGRAA